MEEYQRIDRKNVSDQVYEMLKESIVQGRISAGEKIPSENELSKKLGVSRPTIKAAIERLRAMGLITVRAGDGSYVREFSMDEYIQNWGEYVSVERDMTELMEFRGALELTCLDLAVDRATDEDIEQLRILSEQLVDAFKAKNYDLGAQYDMEFHRMICQCSKNRYFIMIYDLIGSLVFRQIKKLSHDVHTSDENSFLFDDHTRIYEAIRDRDKATSHQLLYNHILNRDSHLESMVETDQKG